MVEQGSQIALFFSNSNIYPRDEYDRRLSYVYRLGNIWGVPVIADSWDHDAWREAVRGLEDEPEQGARCRACFQFSLERTHRKAEELNIPSFTTSLTLSPHKNSQVIFAIGRKFPGFVEENFKKRDGFRRSIQLSREYQLYRQHYCGCEFSHRDLRIPTSDTPPTLSED